MYWPGDFSRPAFKGKQSPIAAKSVITDLDRPVPPGQLRRQEVGRALVLLIRVPGRPLGEPVEPAADRQAADDRAEMAAALRQVPFPGPDVGMEADRRKINVVGRAARVDPDRHQPVADQPLGSRRAANRPIRSGPASWDARSCPDRHFRREPPSSRSTIAR